VWELLSGGRLRIFSNCGPLFDELRLYRRDEKGRIVKKDDHLVDALRYCVRSGRERMKTKPGSSKAAQTTLYDPAKAGTAWMS
jgi:hypothetical protein